MQTACRLQEHAAGLDKSWTRIVTSCEQNILGSNCEKVRRNAESAEVNGGHVWNAKITRSGLQLRSMTDVGGPKGTKDGKSKWVCACMLVPVFLLLLVPCFIRSIHRACFKVIFLACCGHIPFVSLFHKRGLCASSFWNLWSPGRFLLGVVPADTPSFRQAPSSAFAPPRLSHNPRKYLHCSKYSYLLTSDRCPCRWIPHHPGAASFCPWPIRICGYYRPSWRMDRAELGAPDRGGNGDWSNGRQDANDYCNHLPSGQSRNTWYVPRHGNSKELSWLIISSCICIVSLAAIILGRDVILGLIAIYIRYISLPAPKTFIRYWDFSLPSAEVRPTGISKINTALQLALVGWTMSGMAIGGDLGVWGEDGALRAMWWVRHILSIFACGLITQVKKIMLYTVWIFGRPCYRPAAAWLICKNINICHSGLTMVITGTWWEQPLFGVVLAIYTLKML